MPQDKKIVENRKIEDRKNQGFDEKPLARLLEAAFVLQQHAHVRPAEAERDEKPAEKPAVDSDRAAATDPAAPLQAVAAPVPTSVPPVVIAAEPPVLAATPDSAPHAAPAPPVAAKSSADPVSSAAIREASVQNPSTVAAPVRITLAEVAPPEAPAAAAEPQPSASPSTESAAKPSARMDHARALARIVETQDEIRDHNLDLQSALALIVERVPEITQAGGAAIATPDGRSVRYRVSAGRMVLAAGTEVPLESALCAACLRTGQPVRASDVNTEFLLDLEQCRQRGIQAMIAVPVHYEGAVAGAMEAYYASTRDFAELDVHSCQLLAGLISEAFARDEENQRRQSFASERAVMLEALERLRPNLAALAGGAGKSAAPLSATPSGPAFSCRKCGHALMGGENFCGKCGAPRISEGRSPDYEPPALQSKGTSLWQIEEALKNLPAAPPVPDAPRQSPFTYTSEDQTEKPMADSIEEEMPELFASPELRLAKMAQADSHLPPLESETEAEEQFPPLELVPTAPAGNAVSEILAAPENKITVPVELEQTPPEVPAHAQAPAPADTELDKPAPTGAWTSALAARAFLEQFAAGKRTGALARFWAARRGDIYLAIAVIFVAVVIRWGIWSSHSVNATGTPPPVVAGHRKAPDADLSWTDRMMIKFGLAELPPAPEYKGNPETQVWIDLHSALYYCPSDDSYGKTAKGKFSTQRDAQLDQYEPAYRKACD